MKTPPSRSGNVLHGQLEYRNKRRKTPVKAKSSRFDTLAARYYPAVYSFASRLTDDPQEAVALTRDAFNSTRKQLQTCCDENVLASVLISNVIRAGLSVARMSRHAMPAHYEDCQRDGTKMPDPSRKVFFMANMKCAGVSILVSLALASQAFAILRPLFPMKPEPPFGGGAIIIGDGTFRDSAQKTLATPKRDRQTQSAFHPHAR
jgi:hypothetical protein